MRRLRATLALAGLGAGRVVSAAAADPASCGASLDTTSRLLAEAPGWQVAFSPKPAPLTVGRHFSIDLAVCPKDPATRVVAVRIDADMPAHRHGMNYAAKVTALGGNRHRADGLMFHMPGRWRFLFELTLADGQVARLAREVEVQ